MICLAAGTSVRTAFIDSDGRQYLVTNQVQELNKQNVYFIHSSLRLLHVHNTTGGLSQAIVCKRIIEFLYHTLTRQRDLQYAVDVSAVQVNTSNGMMDYQKTLSNKKKLIILRK